MRNDDCGTDSIERINYYSNPDVIYQGGSTDEATGTNEENCAQNIRDNMVRHHHMMSHHSC